MSNKTIAYGVALTGLGVAAFVATGKKHKTALIPAAFGIMEIGLGAMAKAPLMRRPLRGVAAAVAALGIAGTARSLGKAAALARGEQVERPAAVVTQSAMAALSALYLVASLRDLGR